MAPREIVATGCPIHQAPFGPGEVVERRGPEGVHEMVELEPRSESYKTLTAVVRRERQMARVIVGMTMSLDGFVNDRNGEVGCLYPDMEAMRQTEQLQEAIRSTGAVVMGRRSYEMGNGDFTGYELQVPIFVLTHQAPEQVAKGVNDKLTFTFVTEGIERMIDQAKAAAGDKEVTVVGGASTIHQCIDAGLADELHIDLRSVLLGDGLRLFDRPGYPPIELESIGVSESPGVTHVRYRVRK